MAPSRCPSRRANAQHDTLNREYDGLPIPPRLDLHRCVLRVHDLGRRRVQQEGRCEPAQLLPRRRQPAVVAAGHVDGCDDLQRRHAPARGRVGARQGHCQELGMVELADRRDAHDVSVRAAVGTDGRDDRRGVHRAPVLGQVGQHPARFQGALHGVHHEHVCDRVGAGRDREDWDVSAGVRHRRRTVGDRCDLWADRALLLDHVGPDRGGDYRLRAVLHRHDRLDPDLHLRVHASKRRRAREADLNHSEPEA